MNKAFIICLIFVLNLNSVVYAQQLTREQDNIINRLNKLRYNSPDSTLKLVEQKMETIKDQKSVFFTELLFIKSAIQYVQSNYLESRNSYEELYNISKEIHNEVGIARALNGKGLIYLGRELFDEALIEIQKALVINRKIGHYKSMAANLLNIGICYQEIGQWENAYSAYYLSLIHI